MGNGFKERRRSRRFPTKLEGRIVPRGDAPLLECVVCDLSETGVRLALCENGELPLEFELEIPDEGARASVRVIWTNGREVGAEFI
ncbi:PilZ domain-containing protein [Microvirga sp. 17 mud 1-3]|uniref:PilZ domain-containing protein n=1 Tax=Microvirga sp. 17 mud 1-3 TaxID=2082949 RepID=UPI000D6C19CB|nr:hypothetical protein C4E04_01050 [Microvirga sp. 17 mud 1-3]